MDDATATDDRRVDDRLMALWRCRLRREDAMLLCVGGLEEKGIARH